MLTVICGEDSVASRQYLQALKNDYTKKGLLVEMVEPAALENVYKNTSGSLSLFGQQSVYTVDNLSKYLSRRKKSPYEDMVKKLIAQKDIEIIDWEEGKSAYDVSSLKKIATNFREFKPEKSIFQLLDTCFPTNKRAFINALTIVVQTQEETFIFAMLAKHIRTLILAKENALDAKMSPWQKNTIVSQAKLWPTDKLTGFYEGMARIDRAIKTSGTPFNLKKSLDILASYYL